MQAVIRNDVKPSVGRVVTSGWLYQTDVSSISATIITIVRLGCFKPVFDAWRYLAQILIFLLVLFVSEKHRIVHL
jgi:hypothetical protein